MPEYSTYHLFWCPSILLAGNAGGLGISIGKTVAAVHISWIRLIGKDSLSIRSTIDASTGKAREASLFHTVWNNDIYSERFPWLCIQDSTVNLFNDCYFLTVNTRSCFGTPATK